MTLGVVLLLVIGLAVGSFVNVVIWRVPRGESVVRPRSKCPCCGAEIAPRDNIPLVSWLVLKGRCRRCGSRISVRYPLVEAGVGLVFVLFGARLWGDPYLLPAFCYLGAVGIALALIDLDVKRLPNVLTLPSYVAGAALLAFDAFMRHTSGPLATAVAGAAISYVFYFLLAIIRPGGMGWGDVKLSGVLGLYLGYLGWATLAVGTFLPFLFGGAVGLILIGSRHAGRKSKIPYGPSMVLGAFVAILAGGGIAHAYLSLMGR